MDIVTVRLALLCDTHECRFSHIISDCNLGCHHQYYYYYLLLLLLYTVGMSSARHKQLIWRGVWTDVSHPLMFYKCFRAQVKALWHLMVCFLWISWSDTTTHSVLTPILWDPKSHEVWCMLHLGLVQYCKNTNSPLMLQAVQVVWWVSCHWKSCCRD